MDNFEDIRAELYTKKYQAFKKMKSAEKPPPEYPSIDRWEWVEAFALTLLMTASVVVSASRTVPEFGGEIVGWAAFIMLELAIVSYAFIRTRNRPNESTLRNVQTWTNAGLGLAFVVAVSANLHATLIDYGVDIPGEINIGITLLLGFSAPTLALISGDILAIKFLKAKGAKSRSDKEYQEALAAWEEMIQEYWTPQQQKRMGADSRALEEEARMLIGVSAPQLTDGQRTDSGQITDGQRTDSGQITDGQRTNNGRTADNGQITDGQRTDSGRTADGQTDKREFVRTFLADNPDAVAWPVRQIAEKAGVGKTVAAEIVREFRS